MGSNPTPTATGSSFLNGLSRRTVLVAAVVLIPIAQVPGDGARRLLLDAKIAEYVLVARRNGRDWYVGAMSDWTARDLEVDFSFLPEGNYTLESYQDGINADHYASDYTKTSTPVNKGTKLKIHLAPGGGWAGRIHP